jgi:hypothetical protein
MNRKRMSVTLTLSIAFVTTFSIATAPLTSAATKPKAAGRTSTTIPNTILNGKGAPLLKVGIDGDFYIDTRSLLIYGPKKSGKWPLPQNLQGPVGANGADGKNGSEGKTVSTASTIAGPAGSQGSQGLQGEKGEKGEKGDAGSPGATGSAGPAGATGATGPQGPSGGGGGGTPGPTGATGATGATGLTGAKGETGTAGADGVAGAVGLKGETGTVGATGPSNVYRGTFTIPDISGGVGTSQIATIGNFAAGKKYSLTISIVTYQPTRNMDNAFPMGLSISNNVGTPDVWYKYQTFQGISYRSGSDSMRNEYVVIAQVTVDATSSIDASLNIQLIIGYDTSVHLARSEGSYVATLVGSIGAL